MIVLQEKKNYIEYKSKGDRYGNLSPKEYLDVIRPYLRDLINEHKPKAELNNTNDTNNSKNSNNNNTDRAEWKIQLVMQNNFISDKNFEDTRTIYSASKPVEIFMGSDTENIIDTLFNTILNRIQEAMETSNERGSGFTHESVGLLYYHFQKIDIRRGGSYILSLDWIAGLNYNKINEKELKKLLKFRRVDTDFSSYQRDWEEFEQNNTSIALNILFVSYNSEEIKLAYKSNYNKPKNQVILLLINDEANNLLFCCKKLVRIKIFRVVKW